MKELYSRFYIAFTLLTRLPLPFGKKIGFEDSNLAGSSVFYPLIGFFYGLLLFLTGFFCRSGKAGADITAFLLLALPLVLNRFFHFDGLCDVLDAFLSDKPPVERLSIMKDSRIGTYALGGGFLLLLFKFILLSRLTGSTIFFPALILMPVLSRASIIPLAYSSIYPRSSGTGRHLIGRIFTRTLVTSVVFFTILSIGILGFFGLSQIIPLLTAFLLCAIWVIIFRGICYIKIGGVTGDCLGALVETVEIAFLAGVLLLAGVQ